MELRVQDDEKALEDIQSRVRSFAIRYPWFRAALRRAFARMVVLVTRYDNGQASNRKTRYAGAREMLMKGHIYPRDICAMHHGIFMSLVVPKEAQRFFGEAELRDIPPELEGLCAPSILKAICRAEAIDDAKPHERNRIPAAFYDSTVPDGISETDQAYVHFATVFAFPLPADWCFAEDPRSFWHLDLRHYSEADVLAISLYRLGGLADAGSFTPSVPRPAPSGNVEKDERAYQLWIDRIPLDDQYASDNDEPLNPEMFPVHAAWQMFRLVEAWVEREKEARQSSRGRSRGREKWWAASMFIESRREALRQAAFRDQIRVRKRGRLNEYNVKDALVLYPDCLSSTAKRLLA